MIVKSIAERFEATVGWENYEDITGSAIATRQAVYKLLKAQDSTSAENAYWKLENSVVAQGTVYSAAVPVTRILVAALVDELPMPVRIAIMDLLYQILSGAAVSSNSNIIEECKGFVKEGVWLLVREFVFGPREAARDVLEMIEVDIDYEAFVA
ncbi:MAG: hypothetical protein KDD53_11420 [Bdellovibrionales bacterium]|nr:hypothetical protein [Bdellovibrionales bacterium]